MKQVFNAIKSFVYSSPFHHSTVGRRPFFRYVFLLLLAGIGLFISSCQKEELQSPLQKQGLLGNLQKTDLQKKSVPFKGKFTVDPKTDVATGEATHIGKFTAVSQPNTENFPRINSTSISTGANGDQIFTSDIGLFQDLGNGMAEVNIHCTISGGTGRFAGATGSYNTHAIANLALGTFEATMEGTISY